MESMVVINQKAAWVLNDIGILSVKFFAFSGLYFDCGFL